MNKQQPIPTEGLGVNITYHFNNKTGGYSLHKFATGEIVASKWFENEIISYNIVGLLGVLAACNYCIQKNDFLKIYCPTEISYNWAIEKRFNTEESSETINKVIEEGMEILNNYDFTKSLLLWNEEEWGDMDEYIELLDYTRDRYELALADSDLEDNYDVEQDDDADADDDFKPDDDPNDDDPDNDDPDDDLPDDGPENLPDEPHLPEQDPEAPGEKSTNDDSGSEKLYDEFELPEYDPDKKSINIWEGMSPEELEKSFWELSSNDKVSIKGIIEKITEIKKSDKQDIIIPEFDLAGFGNITKKDISDEAGKHAGSKTAVKHDEIMKRLLEEIEKVDFKAKAGAKTADEVSLSNLVVIVVEELTNTAKRRGWNICKNNYRAYFYNGEYWSMMNDEPFQAFLGVVALKMGINWLIADFYIFRQQLFKQFMEVSYFERPQSTNQVVPINVLNGTLEISMENQALRPPRQEDFICYQLPYPYDPAATAPQFEAYLDFALPQDNKKVQDVLGEFMGSVFISNENLKLEKALVLYGQGANGKSVFHDIISKLLGDENVSSFSMANLTDNTGYYRVEFSDKLLNYTSELSSDMNIQNFKAMASGEAVGARTLYHKPFKLKKYGKLAFNCNELPKRVEFTHGFFRKLLIIPFEQIVPLEKQDPGLANKIIATELPGILNWVMAGLKRVLKQHGFTYSAAVEDALNNYKSESDNVSLFLEDGGYQKSTTNYIPLKDFYFNYRAFCLENGYMPGSSKTFSQRLRAMDFVIVRQGQGNIIYVADEFVSTIGL